MLTSFAVQEPYKSHILSGEKTVEWRLNKGKFSSLQVGDLLALEESGVIFQVVNLSHYPSFQTMPEQEGLKHVLPWVQSIEEGVAVYHQFYTTEQEAEFGVVAIHIQRTKNWKT